MTPRRLMHAGIAQDRPHCMKDQHQIVRPGHVDTAPAALIDKLGKLKIDLGIDRFRGKKHDRAVRCLARNDIALGDVGDMFLHVGLHRAAGCRALGLASRDSSGNFESIQTGPGGAGMRSWQSTLRPLPSVCWKL